MSCQYSYNSSKSPIVTTAVIGAGFCGLVATKYLKEAGIRCVCYEASESIGGVWKQAEKFGSTASSSKSYLNLSDFFFDDDVEDFPSAERVMNHINGYALKFDLLDSIRFQTTVKAITFESSLDKWVLTLSHDNKEEKKVFDKLVIATGLCGKPFIPKDYAAMLSDIPSIHCSQLTRDSTAKWIQNLDSDEDRDAHILVVGGGESATDTASVLAKIEPGVILSLRSGRWFLPKWKPPREKIPADLASRRTFKLMDYLWFQRLFDTYLHKIIGEGGHRIEEWIPDKNVTSWGCFLNKRSDQVLPLVENSSVLPVSGIESTQSIHSSRDSKSVVVKFHCGKEYKVKGVVWCTGYERNAIIDNYLAICPGKSLLHVFPANNPSTYGKVAYIGAARPNLGAIPSLAEYASLWVSTVFSGAVSLPPIQSASYQIHHQTSLRKKMFPQDGRKIDVLVHSVSYTDAILRQMGLIFPISLLPPINIFWTYPFWTALKIYYVLITAPWSNREIDVIFNRYGRGLDALERIQSINREKKKRDPDFFVKTLLGDSIHSIASSLDVSTHSTTSRHTLFYDDSSDTSNRVYG